MPVCVKISHMMFMIFVASSHMTQVLIFFQRKSPSFCRDQRFIVTEAKFKTH